MAVIKSKNWKQILIRLLFVVLFLWEGPAVYAAPVLDAEAACLMVANSRKVLYSKNENAIMYPASTTKIMTLLVALERGDLNSVVTVDDNAAGCEGSSLELRAGDRLYLRELLYGMMLVSGNDAALATAKHVAGDTDAFVALMNQKAARLGALNTHFSNPHGLPDPINHFTTARDLAMITAAGFSSPDFVRIVGTSERDIRFLNRPAVHATNTNHLLNSYPGANGVKTGFTNDAGECLVAAARRNGVQLIAVILNSDNRWSDAAKMLDYGFQMASAAGKAN